MVSLRWGEDSWTTTTAGELSRCSSEKDTLEEWKVGSWGVYCRNETRFPQARAFTWKTKTMFEGEYVSFQCCLQTGGETRVRRKGRTERGKRLWSIKNLFLTQATCNPMSHPLCNFYWLVVVRTHMQDCGAIQWSQKLPGLFRYCIDTCTSVFKRLSTCNMYRCEIHLWIIYIYIYLPLPIYDLYQRTSICQQEERKKNPPHRTPVKPKPSLERFLHSTRAQAHE